MKFVVVLLALFLLALTHDCPHDLEVRCIDDINKAYPICDKAAKSKGADIPADLECMKFLISMEQDCWECICWVAQLNHWHIKGC